MAPLELKTITMGAFFYHNAILWERHGFTYFKGGKMMEGSTENFNREDCFTKSSMIQLLFAKKGMEKTVRGRSWAIHDGVLVEAFDEEWESPKMYKMLEKLYG